MKKTEERFLFGVLLVLQVIYYSYLISTSRIPAGHDGFQYLSLQYYFLNNAVTHGEIPLWMPYMTQGTVAGWWYPIQAGFFQNAALQCAFLFKQVNFLYIFYTGMFFDEFILLIGCWLLGRFLFQHALTVFFFSATIMGGCIWLNQPWHNFHLFYCLPLILYFCHRFLQRAQWRYVFAAFNLFLMQCLGNLPYFMPMLSFIIFLYIACYCAFNAPQVRVFAGRIKLSGAAVLGAAANGVMAYVLYAVLTHGTAQVVNYNPGRAMNGLTDLKTFLTYGSSFSLLKWKELILGFSPEIDYSLYGGLILVPLVLWAISFMPNKRNLYLLALLIPLVDFSTGGITAKLAYHTWPLMKYFRGLYLISPVIKLFLVMLAAHALDWFVKESAQGDRYSKNAVMWAAPLMVTVFIAAWHANLTPLVLTTHIQGMLPAIERAELPLLERLYTPVVWGRLSAVFVYLMIYIALWIFWMRAGRGKLLVLTLIAFVHVVDIYSYRFYESNLRSVPLYEQASLLKFEPMPYVPKRQMKTTAEQAPRMAIINELPLRAPYWSNDSFVFAETMKVRTRVDHWLLPLDQFMRTYWGQRINDFSERPKGLRNFFEFHFPLYAPSARKIAGVSEDKIQFFSSVINKPTEEAVSAGMFDLAYAGDVPFVLNASPGDGTIGTDPAANARMKLPYTVDAFSANHLKLTAEVPPGEKAWLMYSDVWHPEWRATVDGKDVKVGRANLAYKIVPLHAGVNHVHFYVDGGHIHVFQTLLGLCAILWLLAIIYAGVRIYV